MGGLASLAACAPSRFRTYDGPEVTSIVVQKGERRMHLMNENRALRSFRFQLGFNPVGHKQFRGDGRTPEGQYWIDRRNPNSAFHLSVGVSYPNNNDRSYARALGRDPGGDIFIHGTPDQYIGHRDWTAGCIAITNREVEDVYAMVQGRIPIFLYA
jgi:murein L,D-transpeptidase YafK